MTATSVVGTTFPLTAGSPNAPQNTCQIYRPGVRANRAFLQRAVRYLCTAGVRQFLDLGSGIPTAGNVHEIAHAVDPAARVAYVDVNPAAVAHGDALLAGTDTAAIVRADLRDVPLVLAAPPVRQMVDFTQPVGVLMIAVLDLLPDSDDPCGCRQRRPSWSWSI